jgi:hypothetical protein
VKTLRSVGLLSTNGTKLLFSTDVAVAAFRKSGGARRDRTDDLKLAKLALSQLSYCPETLARMQSVHPKRTGKLSVVGLDRFELSTSRLSSARSNQLSYRPEIESMHKQRAYIRRKRNEDGGDPRLCLRPG